MSTTTSSMVDTLAEAYFLNGDVDKAIGIEQTLLKKGTGNPEYFARQLDRYRTAKDPTPPSNPPPPP